MPRKRKSRPLKQTRVRSKRLDQLDETKLALALWLMAKDGLLDTTGQADRAADAPEREPEAS